MKPSDLYAGNLGLAVSYSNVVLIIVIMFAMSLRLYLTRRRRGYFTLTLSLLFIMAYYVTLFFIQSAGAAGHDFSRYLAALCRVFSFILINLGVFQLYNPTHLRHRVTAFGALALAVLVSLLHFYTKNLFDSTTGQLALLQDIGLDLYLFLLILLAFWIVTPYIGQSGKYQFALTVYFLSHAAHMLNIYLFDYSESVLLFTEAALTVLYYFLLFLIQFDRVVELLQAVYQSSITDGLTGLYNRKFFVQRLNQYVSRNFPVSVIFSDIDNFKKLNDTEGHHRGDEVLKLVAAIMLEESEEIGVAGRYGGEEMVMLITDTSVDTAELAEHIRHRVESEVGVTVSIGFSQARKGITPGALVKQADEAMYQAKTGGKNRVVKYRRKGSMVQ